MLRRSISSVTCTMLARCKRIHRPAFLRRRRSSKHRPRDRAILELIHERVREGADRCRDADLRVGDDERALRRHTMMYDGSYMALTDQEYGDYPLTGIDEVNIEGTKGIGVRGIELVDNCSPSGYTQIAQPWIQDGLVVGGNLDCPSRFDYWNYTNGGYPVKTIAQGIAPGAAEGQTVSK